MAAHRKRMDQIKAILRFWINGESRKGITRALKVSKNTTGKYIDLFEASGQTRQELAQMDEVGLSGFLSELLKAAESDEKLREEALIGYLESHDVDSQVRRRKATRLLLWQEYLKAHADGYKYSQFCHHLRRFMSKESAVTRFDHLPGEVLMVDFAGRKLAYYDWERGCDVECEVLVCVLPCSGYTYVEALPNQKQDHLFAALGRALKYLGGVPWILVNDNMASMVKKADRYEPSLTDACAQFAAHYGIIVMPTRPRSPHDKPTVEGAVNISYNWIYAPLRNRRFLSIDELNTAIRGQLVAYNDRPYQLREGSRRSQFEQVEKEHLNPLPAGMFELKRTCRYKVQSNFCVMLGEDKHFYSVPHKYIGRSVTVVYTSATVEIYDGMERIACHKRDTRRNGYTLDKAHEPARLNAVHELRGWDPDRFLSDAARIGPCTQRLVGHILDSRTPIKTTYNSCLGVIRLAAHYGRDRTETACCMTLKSTNPRYSAARNILKSNLDRQKSSATEYKTPDHDNVRGPSQFS